MSLAYLFLAVSPLLASIAAPGEGRRFLKLIENRWLGVLLYLVLVVLTTDGVRLLCFFGKKSFGSAAGKRTGASALKEWGRIPEKRDADRKRRILTGGICGAAVGALSLWGMYNAGVIRVTPYEIAVDKNAGELDSLHVVLAADLHLGYSTRSARMKRMVEKINEQKADIVVIAGDIFDNEYEALENPEELAEILRGIRSKYGVYACYGNHDVEETLLVGFPFADGRKKESSLRMDEFLERANIRLLKEEAVLIGGSVYLYGRPDAARPGRNVTVRKTAGELMEGLDSGKPVIVLDHEPKEFQELADAGVDVDLCGHTHDGQTFPANLITAGLWENSYGYMEKDGMDTIVTSGVGVFGPDMRVETRAEICSIQIQFGQAGISRGEGERRDEA